MSPVPTPCGSITDGGILSGRTDGQTEYQPRPLSSFCSLARTRREVEQRQPTSQFASRHTVKSTRAAPAYLVRVSKG